jgi:predicted RNA-binding protein
MCLAAAYQGVESEQPVLREIAHVRLNGQEIELETLFGEKKVLRGRIREIDFMSSRLIIEQ